MAMTPICLRTFREIQNGGVSLDDVSRLKHVGYDAFIKLTHGTCLLSVSKFPLTLSRISLG